MTLGGFLLFSRADNEGSVFNRLSLTGMYLGLLCGVARQFDGRPVAITLLPLLVWLIFKSGQQFWQKVGGWAELSIDKTTWMIRTNLFTALVLVASVAFAFDAVHKIITG